MSFCIVIKYLPSCPLQRDSNILLLYLTFGEFGAQHSELHRVVQSGSAQSLLRLRASLWLPEANPPRTQGEKQ